MPVAPMMVNVGTVMTVPAVIAPVVSSSVNRPSLVSGVVLLLEEGLTP